MPTAASPAPIPMRARRPSARRVPTARRRLLADRAARFVVRGGGLVVIASILAILLFIVVEVAPLFGRASVRERGGLEIAGASIGAVATDPQVSRAALCTTSGGLRLVDLENGSVLEERALFAGEPPPLAGLAPIPGRPLCAVATADGRVAVARLAWSETFEAGRRRSELAPSPAVVFTVDPAGRPVGTFTAVLGDDGNGAVAGLAQGKIAIVERRLSRNPMTEAESEDWSRVELEAPDGIVALALDHGAKNLFAGTARGELVWWRLAGQETAPPEIHEGGPGVSALALLASERSLVVGREDGSLAVWFPVRQGDERERLTRIRDLPGLTSRIEALAPSPRERGFLALDAAGRLGLYHSTSARRLWTGSSPLPGATTLVYTPKADGAVVAAGSRLDLLAVDNPHPEAGLAALFGRVWYEGRQRPEYVWQSSGGTDDFEPKLSLTPLLVGTLKGTLYSLILAVPLAVLGAMYTSQFTHPSLKRFVKPAVEMMAALPSVVLGFLAGLWLAPRVGRALPGIVLALVAGPVAVVLAGFAWRALPRLRRRLAAGSELAIYLVVLTGTIGVSLAASPWVERLAFHGDFAQWVHEVLGLRFDQRNAVVVGLAMGFAVIPIIYSIAEDALSNVPRHLVSGSLALGANRWQTVTRVVLPTASPGIFSAILVGFGRAVGETMIVLMATGNTPIMDWSPFDGFRTLSANIAVEIPEAPYGGTLYRTLFLAALLLFLFTFAVNTAGEIVRQRLRQRYAEL